MNTVPMKKVGSIDVLDLRIISAHHGRDFLPFPFALTRSTIFESEYEFTRKRDGVLERFASGDLSQLRRWAASYVSADIRVEAQLQYRDTSRSPVRLVAHRLSDYAFFARQLPDEDTIEVFSLDPRDIGLAIAAATGTTRPGAQPAIVIPEYVTPPQERDAGDSIIHEVTGEAEPRVVSRSDVAAVATVQSHLRPARDWGLDRGKAFVFWVAIKGDGDYIYSADFKAANPMTSRTLVERVNKLIAEDIVQIRQYRASEEV